MRHRPFLKALCLLALAPLALAGTARAQAALDEVLAKKTITIAIPTDFPP